MLTDYIQASMRQATYRILGDGSYFGEISPFEGLWASGATLEQTRDELRESLEDWIVLALRAGEALPVVDGLDLNAVKAA